MAASVFDDDTKFSYWVTEFILREIANDTPVEHIHRKLGFDQEVVTCIVDRYNRGMYLRWISTLKKDNDEKIRKSLEERTRAGWFKRKYLNEKEERLWDYWSKMSRSLTRFRHLSPKLVEKIIQEDIKNQADLLKKYYPDQEDYKIVRKGLVSKPGSFLEEHEECYLKEAKAMLENKNWQGKNRCVKLIGDD